jgi:excisionase family DNA binding protein
MDRQLLDIDQAATMLGIHVATLYRWTRAKRVPCIRMGARVIRFDPRSLERYLTQHSTEESRTGRTSRTSPR